jgi:hippurate hydrolase
MPVINRIAAYADDMKTWRRHLHAHPELALECFETANFVAARLREFGVDEIHTGIAKTGIVAIINGQGAGPTIGLRADMDALPMTETTDVDWASQVDGAMHACGHDGHTTMLLGAAKYLAETRKFSGRVALIFQPAEETIGGGRIMIEEGMMERFDISQVYGIHNVPNLPLGHFETTLGPLMAGADEFHVDITGLGGHAAYPHETKDPVMVAVAIAQAFQTIVTRNLDPFDQLVLSITQIHAGQTDNVIPETAYMNGTVRIFSKEVQAMVIDRMQAICDGMALSFGLDVTLRYEKGYPPTINNADKAEFAAAVAGEISGPAAVDTTSGCEMGAEDFSYMLEARPGAYLFMGIGDGAGLHNTNYDFNDDAAPYGASFFARLVEQAQPVTPSE